VGPAPHRDRVDPGDHERDEHHPGERLEELQEPEARERQREQLGDVEERVHARERQQDREHPERSGDGRETACTRERERQPGDEERRGDQQQRDDEDVGPPADVRKHSGSGSPRGQRAEHQAQRRSAPPARRSL
jgi:hypothetical protein